MARATVVEQGLAFNPATLEVKVGDTVTFKNEDTAPHNVSINGQRLGSQDTGRQRDVDRLGGGDLPLHLRHPPIDGWRDHRQVARLGTKSKA